MDLLLLAPEVQEEILFLELPPGAQPVSERGLREAVLGTIDWQEQRRRWEGLKGRLTSVEPAEKVQRLDFRGRILKGCALPMALGRGLGVQEGRYGHRGPSQSAHSKPR
jgi:hypothetical protein